MKKDKQTQEQVQIRLDKWIWAARLSKTRALARDWIQAGKVQYQGQRSKPGKIVELGALIRVPAGWDTREVTVLKLFDKRQSAPVAQTMYSETEASQNKRDDNQAARKSFAFHNPKPDQRPDKKQRREIIKLKQQ